jgi:hypothetical protein
MRGVDRGEKLRLRLQAILDERNRRRHVMATWRPPRRRVYQRFFLTLFNLKF